MILNVLRFKNLLDHLVSMYLQHRRVRQGDLRQLRAQLHRRGELQQDEEPQGGVRRLSRASYGENSTRLVYWYCLEADEGFWI